MLRRPDSDVLLLDCELVRCAQEGDDDCFRTLLEHYDSRIRRLVRERVLDESVVEELCQEIRLRAWQKLHTVRQPYFFRWWYYRLAINYVIGWLRGPHEPHESLEDEALGALVSPQSDPESIVLARDLFARAWEEITHELSQKQLETLRLHLFEGRQSEDIALRLDLEESTARNYISTAMAKLRSALYRLRSEDD